MHNMFVALKFLMWKYIIQNIRLKQKCTIIKLILTKNEIQLDFVTTLMLLE